MKHVSSLVRIPAVLLLALASLAAFTTSAEATGGVAPSCVKRSVGTTGGMPNGARVRVTNRCSTTKRVKVVFTHAHDSSCMTIRPGSHRTVDSTVALPFSHYDKTVTC